VANLSFFKRNVSDKREKSWYENIIIVIVIAILMSSVINWYLKSEDNFKQAGYNALAATFFSRITVIRSQWFMDNKPRYVSIHNNGNSEIYTNKSGWVDSPKRKLVCQHIWKQVMESPLSYGNQPISVIEVFDKDQAYQRVCQFINGSGQVIEYNAFTGNISQKYY
jgi:hypothetical protein